MSTLPSTTSKPGLPHCEVVNGDNGLKLLTQIADRMCGTASTFELTIRHPSIPRAIEIRVRITGLHMENGTDGWVIMGNIVEAPPRYAHLFDGLPTFRGCYNIRTRKGWIIGDLGIATV